MSSIRTRAAALLACGLAWGATTLDAQPAIVIRGGTVLPVSGAPIVGGTVVLRGGKIAAVGRNVSIPPGATIVEAGGKYVLPGLIDAMSYYSMEEADLNETPTAVTPELRIIDAYSPFGPYQEGKGGPLRAADLLMGGVTTHYVAPGDNTVVGGQGAVVKTAGANLDAVIVRESAAIDITLGARSTQSFRQSGRSPATRMAAVALLRQALVRAREYDARLRAHEALSVDERRSRAAPTRDLGMEALTRLLRREVPARVQAHRIAEIRAAMQLSADFGFDLVIDGGSSAHEMAAELAARKIPVVLPPLSHPYVSGEEVADKSDYLDPTPRSATLLRAQGVNVAIASFSRAWGTLGKWTGRWLLLNAALAGAHDLPEAEIIRSVTLGPAEILGIADRVGTLEVGKDADVVILDGPPLGVSTWVERAYVNGELVFVREVPPRRGQE